MFTVLVVYNGKRYYGTVVSINRDSNTITVTLSVDGKDGEDYTFDLDDVLALNPGLRGKAVNRW
jgi:hypothetical protein